MSTPKVLLIYTGGTIGMVADARTGALQAVNLDHLEEQVPELARMGINLETVSFGTPIDSSDMHPEHWLRIAQIIGERYTEFDGFVVLHGMGNGVLTIAKGTLPLAVFGPAGLVAATLFYAYSKKELHASGWV